MRISQAQLRRIIAEEYIKEEGIDEALSPERSAEVLAWIKGNGPQPDWLTDDYGDSGEGKAVQSPTDPNVDRAADTMPIPSGDAPVSDYSGFQDRAGPKDTNPVKTTVDGIYKLVSDIEPEDVAEIFQIVFDKLSGVEIQDAPPETLYTPGIEGRPQVGFKEELINKAYARILEMAGIPYNRDYHDMGGSDEKYNVLDPHGLEDMSDAELRTMAEKDGREELLVLDSDGGLINREEVIMALENV